ncbi:MAG: DUF1707 SHOCT-like domain-containing protein [Trebonia sp.]
MPRSDAGRLLIPVLLLLVDPGPRRTPPPRASDADREIAVDMLCAAVADGRLTLAELEERVEAALSARTLTDLATLIADIFPWAGAPSELRREPSRRESTPCLESIPGRESAPARWALIQSLVNAS